CSAARPRRGRGLLGLIAQRANDPCAPAWRPLRPLRPWRAWRAWLALPTLLRHLVPRHRHPDAHLIESDSAHEQQSHRAHHAPPARPYQSRSTRWPLPTLLFLGLLLPQCGTVPFLGTPTLLHIGLG